MPIPSVSADPLFSSIITIYILILLYFPSPCIGIVLSPVLISTSVILLSLLRLGAIQKKKKDQPSDPDPDFAGDGDRFGMMGSWEDRDPGVGAPLEVIHEGPENDDALDGKRCGGFMSLSEVYPETDSESDFSSEAGNVDEEDRDGMIEIVLSNDIEEEDNLIEIDLHLSVAR